MASVSVRSHQLVRTTPSAGLVSSVVFAGLTGLAAQIVIPLQFTPVPITLQTFVVLLSGYALGKTYGPLSQVFYISLGVIGVPWFANNSSGLDVLLGATGGYLLGFVVASLIIGYISDLEQSTRSLVGLTMTTALGTILIYIVGVVVLMITANLSLMDSLLLGFFPFLPGDLLKLIGVVTLAKIYLPKEGVETDRGLTKRILTVITAIFLIVSTILVVVFVLYLLNAGDQPPVYLSSYSLLSLVILLPTLMLTSRYGLSIPSNVSS